MWYIVTMSLEREKIQQEVDKNYAFFQKNKQEISDENFDKFVLIRSEEFIGFYSTKEDRNLKTGFFPCKKFLMMLLISGQ